MSQSTPNDTGGEAGAGSHAGGGAENRRQASTEEWIRLAEQAARPLIVGEPACTVSVNRELIIRDVDAAGATWAELESVEQARGRSLLDFVAPELHEAVRAATTLVFAGQMRQFRGTAITAKGRRRIVEAWASLSPAAPEAGQDAPELCATVVLYDITDLSMVAAERDTLASIVRTAHDAIISVSREGRITSWNPAAEKLYGYSANEALGKGFELYVPPEGLAQVREAFAEVIATGRTASYEQRRRRRDGSWVDVWLGVFPTCDSAGNITGTAGVARDITRQKQIDKELREAQAYTRSLVESSLDALLVGDSNFVLTDVNEQAVRLTGYSREELTGIELASIFTNPERVRQVAREALEKGMVHEAELELLTRKAQTVAVSLNASAYRDAEGSVRGVLVAARDIGERKRAERERSLLAAVVNSSGKAIYSATPDLKIGTWNAAAERLFGYSGAEIIGRNLKLLVPLDLRGELAGHLERLRQSGESQRYESRQLRKDGSGVDVSIVASPIFESPNHLTAISIVARDISERKRIDAQLTAARDAALESAQARSNFLANISHEIRTPLNSIIGMTGLLLDTPLNAEQLEFARDVRDSGEALLGLINDVLDFSKITAGRLVFEEVDFELGATVEATVELVADRARRKGSR